MKDLQEKNGTLDLSKPFFRSWKEGNKTIFESNLPNDSIGDYAFEWDIDGSKRKKWDEYLKELDEKGIRGQLHYQRGEMEYNLAFDESDFQNKEYPLSSYKMIIEDYGK